MIGWKGMTMEEVEQFLKTVPFQPSVRYKWIGPEQGTTTTDRIKPGSYWVVKKLLKPGPVSLWDGAGHSVVLAHCTNKDGTKIYKKYSSYHLSAMIRFLEDGWVGLL